MSGGVRLGGDEWSLLNLYSRKALLQSLLIGVLTTPDGYTQSLPPPLPITDLTKLGCLFIPPLQKPSNTTRLIHFSISNQTSLD